MVFEGKRGKAALYQVSGTRNEWTGFINVDMQEKRRHIFPNVDIYSAFGYSYPRVFGHVYIIDLHQYVFGYL